MDAANLLILREFRPPDDDVLAEAVLVVADKIPIPELVRVVLAGDGGEG